MKIAFSNMNSGRPDSLKTRLFVVQSVIVFLPCLTLIYLYFLGGKPLDLIHLIILTGILFMVLGGLILLRQIFDRFFQLSIFMKKASVGEIDQPFEFRDTKELSEITNSFNSMMADFRDSNRELKQRIFELLTIRELTEIASKTLDFEELLKVLLDKSMKVLGSESGLVLIFNKPKNELQILTCNGIFSGLNKERMPLRGSSFEVVIREKKSAFIRNSDWFPNNPVLCENSDSGYCLSMPVMVRDRLVAILNLSVRDCREDKHPEKEKTISILIGNIGFALENAILHSKVKKHSAQQRRRADELAEINNKLQQTMLEREKARNALQTANDQLELRVEERTNDLRMINKDLKKAKIEAEAANMAKSRFLSSMSHELLTPLNAVIGFGNILKTGSFGTLNEKQDRYVENIIAGGEKLLDVVRVIIELSDIDFGRKRLELSQFHISDEIAKLIQLVKNIAGKKDIMITMDLPNEVPLIVADRGKVKQVVFNLLDNAIKFSPDGGNIHVNVTCKTNGISIGHTLNNNSNDYIQISVQDEGVGIAPEDFQRIFNVFEQADASSTRNYEGTGIGLALSRKIVEMHKGKIWVESDENKKGSTFVFTLPISSPISQNGAISNAKFRFKFEK